MSDCGIPFHVIFSPSWWRRNCGISFHEPFYLDAGERMHNDVVMRRELHRRFGYGVADPQPRPIIGSRHIAGGFVVPALLGVPVRFGEDQAAWPLPLNLGRDETLALRVPDLRAAWPMAALLEQMDELEARFGYVTGDLNTGGLLNTALEVRGQQFFLDLAEDAELTRHLLGVITETQAAVAEVLRRRCGTCSVAVNRSIVDVDPSLHISGNCAVQMISPALYRKTILPYENVLAARLEPFGIHHCGSNLHRFLDAYGELRPRFLDVGWGSNVARCGALPEATFVNLRLSPVRLLECTAEEVRGDTLRLLVECGRKKRVGVCAINLDAATPDANVRAARAAVREFERSG